MESKDSWWHVFCKYTALLYAWSSVEHNRMRIFIWRLTHPFLELASARSSSWQTVHARVGGVVWWTSTFRNRSFTFWLFRSCWPCSSKKKLRRLWSGGAYCVPEASLKSWQRPTLHATLTFYAFTLLALYTGYKLEGFWVKAEFMQSTVQRFFLAIIVQWCLSLSLERNLHRVFLILSHCLKNTGQD